MMTEEYLDLKEDIENLKAEHAKLVKSYLSILEAFYSVERQLCNINSRLPKWKIKTRSSSVM